MVRSLWVRSECIGRVKLAVKRSGFSTQQELAENLVIALSTVSNFLNGKCVSVETFKNMCLRLALDWREIADLSDPPDPPDDEPEPPDGENLWLFST